MYYGKFILVVTERIEDSENILNSFLLYTAVEVNVQFSKTIR
jgi:hypothetical protein